MADLLALHGGPRPVGAGPCCPGGGKAQPLDDPLGLEKSIVEENDGAEYHRRRSRGVGPVPTTPRHCSPYGRGAGLLSRRRKLLRLVNKLMSPRQGCERHTPRLSGRARRILVQDGALTLTPWSADNANGQRGALWLCTTQSLLTSERTQTWSVMGRARRYLCKESYHCRQISARRWMNARDSRPDYKGYTALPSRCPTRRRRERLLKAGADVPAEVAEENGTVHAFTIRRESSFKSYGTCTVPKCPQ